MKTSDAKTIRLFPVVVADMYNQCVDISTVKWCFFEESEALVKSNFPNVAPFNVLNSIIRVGEGLIRATSQELSGENSSWVTY